MYFYFINLIYFFIDFNLNNTGTQIMFYYNIFILCKKIKYKKNI